MQHAVNEPKHCSTMAHLRFYPSIYLSVYLSFYLSIYLSIYLYIYTYMSICLSIHILSYLGESMNRLPMGLTGGAGGGITTP